MALLRILAEKWRPPTEVGESFEGQVILVTGANTGLGLEAAKKVAALGPDKLIVTTRSQAKGESTKLQIEQWVTTAKCTQRTEIIPLVLDMGSSAGVKAFAEQLDTTTKKLDAAVLNAGMNQPQYRTSGEGFEETLQVNTVSTIFLATLLLPLLASTAASSNRQTRLTFVSSRNSTLGSSFPTARPSVLSSTTPLKTMSQPEHFPSGVAGGQIQYGRSKLMLEYAVRRMAQLPAVRDAQKSPLVIINSVCPGMTQTDLARNYEHWFARALAKILFTVLAQTAEAASNSYLQALTSGDECMGRLWSAGHFVEEWDALKSDEGRKLGNRVWEEMKVLMQGWDSSVAGVLEGKV
ncbi:hypothetical protein LTR70_002996 [Exophiala xenobiotica]|uniref:Uncharacterized protein n=1 Tax=Lithohypha guttulata TaxID=1690604 RepID=A0ABR0K8F1_9EURO|nr:hypothetical protein LTR24_005676 [Lithohypha guttulata]KAK5324366.1 hypothetical protein LTR70_002996 [Exophiala xenobiotica]